MSRVPAGGEAAPHTSAPGADEPWPSGKTTTYTMVILILSLTFAQLDLQIVSLLVEPIKRDLQLSDFNFSLLTGVAFALFYTLFGVPVAWFIDRGSRKKILAAALATWSAATALTGLAQNFAHMFVARLFVGAGEAVNGPASYSIVSDLFPREKLTRAIAFLQLGSVIGPGIAMLISGFLITALIDIEPLQVPWGIMYGWQIIFVMVGLPGLVVALLMWTTMREPKRRPQPGAQPKKGFGALVEAYGYVALKRPTVFMPFFISLAISGLDASRTWMPAFYAREFGWNPGDVAKILGISALIATPLGLWIGTLLTERLQTLGRPDAPVLVVIFGRLIGLPFTIFGVLLPNPWLVIATSIVGSAVLGMTGAPLNAAMQSVTPNHLRGQITALYLFIFNVVGFGIGPSVVAAITNFVIKDEQAIKWSIFTAHIAFLPLSLLVFALGLKPYLREVNRIKAMEAAATT